MKLLIASDLHGSGMYAENLIEAFNNEKADKLLLLGDILYHGPRNALPYGYEPKKVIELLNNMKDKILCVRGNCDTEVDQMVLEFPIMAEYILLALDDTVIFATHGHKFNSSNLPPLLNKNEVLIYGHTHVPEDTEIDGIRILNPGSVSIPKNNSKRGYIIYENNTFTFKTLCD